MSGRWSPDERRQCREITRRIVAFGEALREAQSKLTGTDDTGFWRVALEVLRATALSPTDYADLSLPDALAVLRAAADMKREQRADVLKAIREATTYGPKPGTRAAQVLTALLTMNAVDRLSAVSTRRLVKAIGSYAEPGSLKTVICELRRHGLIATAQGRAGGCWLTDLGRHLAEHVT